MLKIRHIALIFTIEGFFIFQRCLKTGLYEFRAVRKFIAGIALQQPIVL